MQIKRHMTQLHASTLESMLRRLQNKWKQNFQISENSISLMQPRPLNRNRDVMIKRFLQDVKCCLKAHNWKVSREVKTNICSYAELGDEIVQKLCSSVLPNFKNTTKLSINFYGGREVSDYGFEHVGLMLSRNFLNLRKLSLDLSCEAITDDGIKLLTPHIGKYLQSLKHLDLRFYDDLESITDKGVRKLTFEIHRRLRKLQHLTVMFHGFTEVTDKAVNTLSKSTTRHLKSLSELAVQFPLCDLVTDETFNALTSLRNFKPLKVLKLDFRQCDRISDKGLELFCHKFVPHLRNIKKFAIRLTGIRPLSEEAFTALTDFLTKHMQGLRHLKLDFSFCPQVNDSYLQVLGSQINERLVGLQNLKLNFEYCSGITDKGVQALFSQLPQSLVWLKLNFSGCPITGKDQTFLNSQGSVDLHRLKNLSLTFSSNNYISAQGIRAIFYYTIYCTKLLKKVSLDFHSCAQIHYSGLKVLFADSKNFFTNVNECQINFANCMQINKENKDELKRDLEYIPKLAIE